jgi:ribosomal protein S27AE
MANIYCPSCGTACPPGANFCLSCGKALPRDYSALPPKKESDFITLACPNCGGSLKITQDMERFACQYCGYEHIVRRNGNMVSLQPVMEGLKRVENKFDHVLSGSDRMAAEQTIQRLNREIDELQKQISAKEEAITKAKSGNRSTWGSIIFLIVLGSIAVVFFSDSGGPLTGFFLILSGIGVISGFIKIIIDNQKNSKQIQEGNADLLRLRSSLELRQQQLNKLDRYTTER